MTHSHWIDQIEQEEELTPTKALAAKISQERLESSPQILQMGETANHPTAKQKFIYARSISLNYGLWELVYSCKYTKDYGNV